MPGRLLEAVSKLPQLRVAGAGPKGSPGPTGVSQSSNPGHPYRVLKLPLAFALLLSVSAPLLAAAPQRHDEKALKQKYDTFVESLDFRRVSRDYPKAVRNLDSVDPKTQLAGIKTLGATGELEVLPWLAPFVDSKERDVRIYAGLSLFQTVTSHELKRRDMTQPGKVVIKPPGPDDIDLRPMAWVILKMFRTADTNVRSYAANMAGYLSLCEFEGELRQMVNSRHPAESRAARSAMHMAGIDLVDEARPE